MKSLSNEKKTVNKQWLENLTKLLKVGGFWVWPDRGHQYMWDGMKLHARDDIALKDLKNILPDEFANDIIGEIDYGKQK